METPTPPLLNLSVYRDHMRIALHAAIQNLEAEEKSRGYFTDSGNLAVIRQMLAVINDGGTLSLRD